MGGYAERGMSAPPEVVFNTATDPDRADAWLPEELRAGGGTPARVDGELLARWNSTTGPAELRVEPGNTGGSRVRLRLPAGSVDGLAEESLVNLEREVAENLTAG
ncbi:hypothetical protein [Micromonospora sp. NPDC092111]|uniref:hypothetical protein n=1 Tax=Micromonospora sp. NPDC092111 TaxID=3364289 RepID=UPI00380AB2F6